MGRHTDSQAGEGAEWIGIEASMRIQEVMVMVIMLTILFTDGLFVPGINLFT